MKNFFAIAFLGVFLMAGGPNVLVADVRMPAIFSDHMVLQSGVEVPVWGVADPGESVSVAMNGQSQSTTAGTDGKWMIRLHELSVGSPATLKILGKNEIVIQDVLVGEVWLGSGQSNMAMNVKAAKDFATEQATAQLPLIRMFKEDSSAATDEQTVGKGQWVVCSPESVGGFSATLFFFGREIHKSLGVPVGLINSSVGGTPIESWIAPDVQLKAKELKPFFNTQKGENNKATPEAEKGKYEKELAAWQEASKKARAENQKPPRKPVDPNEVRSKKGNVGGLFNGKIAPLIPYAIRGALWYQGEANSTPAKAPFYEHQLPLLVNDWRARWGYDFPFAWAQLPNFSGEGRDWPTVREAMRKTLSIPKTGMGINIDIGDKSDIHPKNKQEVGRRLSLWALGTVYGKDVIATSGPLLDGHEAKGSEIFLSFKHTNGGLSARDGGLKGFVIAGEDRQWKKASASIRGDNVIVSSSEVAKPVAVRYAWENFPDCNLFNGAGLPASPFRTDDWSATAKPNVVVIFIDDLGYADIGPYGATKQKTPHLDRLAREGMKLTSFYAAPVCSVSRAQLLTGCYGARVSVPGVFGPASKNGLNPNEITIAERLKEQGYASICIGKWHVGDQKEFLPLKQGFDHYFGIPYSNDMQRVSSSTGKKVVPLLRDDQVIELLTDEEQSKIVERYTDEAVGFIRSNKDKPFLLYLPHTAVHTPIWPGEKFRGKSNNGRFGDWVEEVDWSVGKVLDTLRDLKLDNNTLVVFTSDNGPWLIKEADGGSALPLRGGKGSTWEGGVRVPTIAWWPGKIAPGSVCDAVAGTIDLMPTLVSIAGGVLPSNPTIDGKDITPLLFGTSTTSPREAHYYFAGYNLQAVRQGPWKLAVVAQPETMGKGTNSDAKSNPRLYNLDQEIGEQTNLADKHPDIVARLTGLADKMSAEIGGPQAPARRPAGVVDNPDTLYPSETQKDKSQPAKK